MIEFRESEVATGSAITGSVTPAAGANVAWLVWRLELIARNVLMERGTAIEDYAVVGMRRLEAGPEGAAFEFRIPDAGPISYDGRLFRVIWEVVAGTESVSGKEIAEFASFKVVASRA